VSKYLPGAMIRGKEDIMTTATLPRASAVGQDRSVGLPISEQRAWQAINERDDSFSGVFIVGVTSTGIYCRPGCPSRVPMRKNMRFFATPAGARAAGFRACKRCKPDDPLAPAAQLAEQARAYLEAHIDEPVTLAELGKQVGCSPYHLQRVFKKQLGVTPKEFVAARRVERFKSGLKNGGRVTDAIYDAGYGSSSRGYESDPLAMTPSAYRDGGRGMDIRYTVVPSSVGRVLVGATQRGICSVMIGDSNAWLVDELCAEFPNANVSPANDGLGELANAVVRVAEGQPSGNIPLDVRGTAFQLRVWRALRAIPVGHSMTYSQIAALLGSPKAARAVGRACATNQVALVIPCHRAVREDGSLGGFRWGLDRKQKLLDTERHAAATAEVAASHQG
jgi:AraC family transcriptional regulator of adaptative response/methylated-DNA-[protein]-cysteine methyltransferase